MDSSEPAAEASGQLELPLSASDHASVERSTLEPTPATGAKLGKHHRRNSTVEEQRALRVKAAELEREMSLPRVRLKTVNCLT
jgi:hypothetical protein